MGLAAAFFIASPEIHVTVIEKEPEIGGLCRSEEVLKGLKFDRFYHVILSQDDALVNFLKEIDLTSEIGFTETKTGFFVDRQLHSLSNIAEFVTFKPLSVLDRIRLGAGIFYAARLKGGNGLETLSAEAWLTRVFGRKNYSRLWEPLLRCKLGSESGRSSASFIHATIKRYYGTRHQGSKKERMGYVRGGYDVVLRRLRERLVEKGVTILPGTEVIGLEERRNKKLRLFVRPGGFHEYERIVATVPSPRIIQFLPQAKKAYKEKLGGVDYLSLVCATIICRRSLSPYYIVNLVDRGFPFTGLIEMTNVVPCEEFGDYSVLYLPRYTTISDPLLKQSDEEIINVFLNGLQRIFPDLLPQEIVKTVLHREPYVEPIRARDYLRNRPSFRTPIKNFYVLNNAMISDSTLNNNEVIKLAKEFSSRVLNS